MTDPSAPRYSTLRDYLAVLRRRRLIVLLTTVVFAAAAYMVSAQQDDVYRAESALSFREISQDLGLLGTPAAPIQSAEQRAAIQSKLITRPEVVRRVKRELGTRRTEDELRGLVNSRAEARTDFVVIEAEGSSGREAADIANAFAKQARLVATADERRRFREAADVLQDRFEQQLRRRDDPYQRALLQERIARLEASADFANPVEIARTAGPPASPASPKPLRDTLLAALVGFTLGILAAFARDSLDRRLRGSREIQEQLGLPLLGHVSDDALGGSVVQRDNARPLTPLDLEAFRILRTNLEFLSVDQPPRVIAVTSALPEEGKTTVAAALAAVFAASGRDTLLVECDLRRPTLSERLSLESSPGLSDYLAGHAKPAEVLREVQLGEMLPPGSMNGGPIKKSARKLMAVLAGSRAPEPAELLGSERFRTFVDEVRQDYDVVVIDTSPVLAVVDALEVVSLADAVLLCVRAAKTTREQAAAAKAAIEHLPTRPAGIVVTGIRARDEGYGYYSYSYSYSAEKS